MREKPVKVVSYMNKDSGQVMFTLIYADGYRVVYWLPFWRGVWEAIRFIWSGVEFEDDTP